MRLDDATRSSGDKSAVVLEIAACAHAAWHNVHASGCPLSRRLVARGRIFLVPLGGGLSVKYSAELRRRGGVNTIVDGVHARLKSSDIQQVSQVYPIGRKIK